MTSNIDLHRNVEGHSKLQFHSRSDLMASRRPPGKASRHFLSCTLDFKHKGCVTRPRFVTIDIKIIIV